MNNNLQRRTVKAPRNGVGLENIKAKYLLLKKSGFQVMEDEKNFTVVLLLIWKGTARKWGKYKMQKRCNTENNSSK